MPIFNQIPRIPRILIALGILCLIFYRMIEPLEENDVLKEPFALLPIGIFLICMGALWVAVSFLLRALRRRR